MKDWTTFNVKYFAIPMSMLVIGVVIGFGICDSGKPKKQYLIEVQTYWSTNGYQSYPTMKADSLENDTIWKDGLKIVNKNIINVTFK